MELSFDRMLGIVGVLGILIGVGVAIAMDPKNRSEMHFAIGCFVFSGMALTATVGLWAFKTDLSLVYRISLTASLCAGVCVSMVEASRWAESRFVPIVEEMKEKPRATLHWYKTYPTYSPDAFQAGKSIDFSVTFLNVGNDRAVRVYGAVTLYFAEGKTASEASYIAAWFEPLWQQKLAQQRLVDSKGRVIDPVRGDVKDEFGMHLHAPVLTKEVKEKIIDQKQFMWIVGALRYEDSEGEHEFQFLRCLLPPFSDLKSWTAETVDVPKSTNGSSIPTQQSQSLNKPSAAVALTGRSDAPQVEVTNHGAGADFYARLEISGSVMGPDRDVFAKWAHSDSVKTRIAKGETCRINIARLDWSYGRDTCQWKIIALSKDHHVVEIPAIYSSAALSSPIVRAGDIVVRVFVIGEPDLENGIQQQSVTLKAFGVEI